MKDAASNFTTDTVTNRTFKPCLSSCRMRCLKGKGALLVLVWNMLTFSYFGAQSEILQEVLGSSKPYTWIFSGLVIRSVFLILFYPLAGWLADVYFGRYRVIRFGLWLMWIGTILLIVVLLFRYIWHDLVNSRYHAIHVTIACIIFLLINIGLAAFQVNIIPFGTDQLQGAPAEELSSFVHWFFWTEYCGGLATYFLACIHSLDENDNILIQAIVEAACLSLALILDFFCRDWLVTEPKNQNPLKNILDVLKYSAKTKYPQQRSAFTYCEEDIPSRINFGKRKYGGPFTNEQVEDVKTFMRILLILSVLGCSIVVRIGAENAIDILTEHIGNTTGVLQTPCQSYQLVRTPGFWVIVIGIPLHELLLYPLFHNYIPTMLRRIGIGIFIAIISIVSQLFIDLVPHLDGHDTAACIFSDTNSYLGIDHHWIVLPYFLNGLVRMLIYIAAFEFIISQSPHAMKGLFFGLFYCLRGVFIIIACVIIIIFYIQFASRQDVHPSCGFWYYVLNLLIGIVGFTIYCIAAKNYRNRQRDEVVNEYKYAEVYYDKYSNIQ